MPPVWCLSPPPNIFFFWVLLLHFYFIKILLFPAPAPPPQPATSNDTAKLHWIPTPRLSFLIFFKKNTREQEYLTLHTFT